MTFDEFVTRTFGKPRTARASKHARLAYLEQLWEAHDWMEREILREERHFSDRELDRMLSR